MPSSAPRRLATLVGAVVLASAVACSSSGPTPPPGSPPDTAPETAAPAAAFGDGLVPTTVAVPAGMAEAPFDTPRLALVPPGWTMSVWARVPSARLAASAPDGALLVSQPDSGEVVRLVPGPAGATSTVLLRGLTQPHGLAFAGSSLYVAQSDRVDVYDYAAGAASAPRPVVTNLPDAKSPDLKGPTPTLSRALRSDRTGRSTSRWARPRTSPRPTGQRPRSGPRSCGSRRAAGRRRPSPAASATAPGSRSLPTVRCGPR